MLPKLRLCFKTCCIVVIAIFILLTAGGCIFADPGRYPSRDDYVGVWACYSQVTDEPKSEYSPETLDEVRTFLVLEQNGEAQIILRLSRNEVSSIDCKWVATHEDKERRQEEGIVLVGDDFDNPYSYIYYPEKSSLIDECLIDGFLSIDYGYRRDYFEKISSDQNYQPWLIANHEGGIEEPPDGEILGDVGVGSEELNSSLPSNAISWLMAPEHIGESASVYGLVVDSEFADSSNGQPTFLDLGAPYPDKDRVTVVIWGDSRSAFTAPPEALYKDKTICVTGDIYIYDDVCNIEVTSPDQIIVVQTM